MKEAKKNSSRGEDRPTEAEIREYAHHLYVSSGWLPGRDLDNWLQAEAHLIAERNAKHARHHRGHHGARIDHEAAPVAAAAHAGV